VSVSWGRQAFWQFPSKKKKAVRSSFRVRLPFPFHLFSSLLFSPVAFLRYKYLHELSLTHASDERERERDYIEKEREREIERESV
jgi:hypothetical protein